MNNRKTAIIISGMHIGATSFIANVVHMLGYYIPARLMPVQPDYPSSFFLDLRK